MRYNFSEEFKGLSNGEINRDAIGSEQRKLLEEWMGRGVQGAVDAMGDPPPSGIDERTLRAYHEVARRIIEADNDSRGTQAARIELIEQGIEELRGRDNAE